jgi:gas vesicle protein
MKINKIEDLIPYRVALQELWLKEEFQPVMGLLNSLKEEALSWARYDTTKESADTVKAISARVSTQLRVTEILLELPQRLRALEEQLNHQEVQTLKMKRSQEGGEV